jgi:hypothetical protein
MISSFNRIVAEYSNYVKTILLCINYYLPRTRLRASLISAFETSLYLLGCLHNRAHSI